MKALLLAGTILAAGGIAGCGSSVPSPQQIQRSLNAAAHASASAYPTSAPSSSGGRLLNAGPPAHRALYDFDGRGADVSARRFGAAWPLTVKSGRVNCVPVIGHRIAAVFTADDRRAYWLNDVARRQRQALDTRDPAAIRLAGHARGFAVLEHICDPMKR